MKTLFLTLIVLITFNTLYGQREQDTVKVILIGCDTARPYYAYELYTFDSVVDGHWVGHTEYDTTYFDYYNNNLWWIFGLEVLEKHNTSEGVMHPSFRICVNDQGERVSCYHDYWVHVKYLDIAGLPLEKGVVIWQSIKIKK